MNLYLTEKGRRPRRNAQAAVFVYSDDSPASDNGNVSAPFYGFFRTSPGERPVLRRKAR